MMKRRRRAVLAPTVELSMCGDGEHDSLETLPVQLHARKAALHLNFLVSRLIGQIVVGCWCM